MSDTYESYRNDLVKAGLLIPSGVPGLFGRGGAFENVIRHFEAYVATFGAKLNAEEMCFPPILARETYCSMDHIHNFPDLLGSIHSFFGKDAEHAEMIRKFEAKENWTSDLGPAGVVMVPAACYPLYPAMTGTLPKGGRTIQLTGYVFRHEPSNDPARMQIFRQCEYVRLGTPDEARANRDFWLETGEKIHKSLGLDVKVVVASDPFFGRGGRLRKATQKEQDLKHEIEVAICSVEKPTAITSCNYHLDSFGAKFKIKTADGETAHTSCVGFGLERVALALFKTHGLDTKKWPAETRKLLKLA